MYYSIKKNQKKLMALFAVLLMISFVATFSVGRSGGGSGRADTVVAHIGSTPVYDSELRAAQNDWTWARRTPVSDPIRGQELPVAIDAIVFGASGIPRPPAMPRDNADFEKWFERSMRWRRVYGLQYQVGMSIADSFYRAADQHNELLYLLPEEARRDGLQVDPNGDLVNAYLFNALGVQPSQIAADSTARSAVQRLLLVGAEIERLKNSLKVSQPLWRHEAVDTQSVRLTLLDYRSSDFERSIPAPTTQQVQQQFDRFKNTPPHISDASNPLGFGYQIPARVKLQYVEIPHAQVVQAILHTVHPPGGEASVGSSDPQYDWEVQAASYYESHQDEFKNPPPPETAPSTRTSDSQPASTQAAESRPTSLPAIKPFDEVKQQIIDKLTTTEAEKLLHQIADELSARLESDYQAVHRSTAAMMGPALPQTQAAERGPATGPAASLMSLAQLEQIRDQIQQKYRVAIELHEIASGWQTQSELEKLPGIGASVTADHTAFANLATSFQFPVSISNEHPLKPWQPSPPLSDEQQNTYLFRLTAAEPPHAPPDLTAIAAQVAADWKLSQAYDQAMQAAQKALASAKVVGLSQAARTLGQTTIATPLFPPKRAEEIPGYPLANPAAEQALARATGDLLTQANPADPRPDALVPLPTVTRVAVIELAATQLPEPEWIVQYSITQQQQMTEVQHLTQDWFNYDRVVARTGYKPEPKT